jgi:hypothetical protein
VTDAIPVALGIPTLSPLVLFEHNRIEWISVLARTGRPLIRTAP